MGSYATYGSAGTSAIVIKQGAPETPAVEASPQLPTVDGVIDPTAVTEGAVAASNFIQVIDGHIFISGISALDVGSIVVIGLTTIATLMKTYYDFVDWRERRLARRQQQEITDGQANPPP